MFKDSKQDMRKIRVKEEINRELTEVSKNKGVQEGKIKEHKKKGQEQKIELEKYQAEQKEPEARLLFLTQKKDKNSEERQQHQKITNELKPKRQAIQRIIKIISLNATNIQIMQKKQQQFLVKQHQLKDQLKINQPYYQLTQEIQKFKNQFKKILNEHNEKTKLLRQKYKQLKQSPQQKKLRKLNSELMQLCQQKKKLQEVRVRLNKKIVEKKYSDLIHPLTFPQDVYRDQFPTIEDYYTFLVEDYTKPMDLNAKKKYILKNLITEQTFKEFYDQIMRERVRQKQQQDRREEMRRQDEKRRHQEERLKKERQQKERIQKEEQIKRQNALKAQKQNRYKSNIKKIEEQIQQIMKIKLKIESINFNNKLTPTQIDNFSKQIRQDLNDLTSKKTAIEESLKQNQILQKQLKQNCSVELLKKIKLIGLEQFIRVQTMSIQNQQDNARKLQKKLNLEQNRKKNQKLAQKEINPFLPPKSLYFKEVKDLEKKVTKNQLDALKIRQKYVNQVKILFELNLLTKEEIEANNFDLATFRVLLLKKGEFIDKLSQIKEGEDVQAYLGPEFYGIQNQLQVIQQKLNLETMLQPYRYKREDLVKTKQQLYVNYLEQSLQQKCKILDEQTKYTQQLTSTFQKNTLLLKQKQQQLKQRKIQHEQFIKEQQQALIQQNKEKLKQKGQMKQNNILNESLIRQQYMVSIINKEEIDRLFVELTDQEKLALVTEQLEKKRIERQQLEDELKEIIKRQSHKQPINVADLLKRSHNLKPDTRGDHQLEHLERQMRNLKLQCQKIHSKKKENETKNRSSNVRFYSLIL